MIGLVPQTFLASYISSYSHPVRTSFDSHHLVLFIYLIPNTSRVRISIVIDQILRQCTSYYISTQVFSIMKILSQLQTTYISNHIIHLDFPIIHSYTFQFQVQIYQKQCILQYKSISIMTQKPIIYLNSTKSITKESNN